MIVKNDMISLYYIYLKCFFFQDLQIRLDSERTDRNNSEYNTLKLITEIKQTSREAKEMRDQENR